MPTKHSSWSFREEEEEESLSLANFTSFVCTEQAHIAVIDVNLGYRRLVGLPASFGLMGADNRENGYVLIVARCECVLKGASKIMKPFDLLGQSHNMVH